MSQVVDLLAPSSNACPLPPIVSSTVSICNICNGRSLPALDKPAGRSKIKRRDAPPGISFLDSFVAPGFTNGWVMALSMFLRAVGFILSRMLARTPNSSMFSTNCPAAYISCSRTCKAGTLLVEVGPSRGYWSTNIEIGLMTAQASRNPGAEIGSHDWPLKTCLRQLLGSEQASHAQGSLQWARVCISMRAAAHLGLVLEYAVPFILLGA